MIVPTIHINGTSGPALLEQATGVLAALRIARDAMQSAAPHGRDYYTQGDDALRLALNAHTYNLGLIDGLMAHYQKLAEAIVDQPTFKRG